MVVKNEMEAIKALSEKFSSGVWTPVLSSLNETAPTVSLTMQQRKICKNWKVSFCAVLSGRTNNCSKWNK